MSSTSKGRLQTFLTHLDALFNLAHPADVPELAKEIREQLTLKVSAAKRGDHYDRHVNPATAAV